MARSLPVNAALLAEGKLKAKDSWTMPNIIIESLGVYLPERALSTKEVLKSCKSRVWFPLERVTGIQNRRVAGENEFSVDLAREAISRCFERSKYGPADIDLLVCCNISRYNKPSHHTFEPGTAIQLKQDFGFERALCFDISNACAGMLTGIHLADGFIKSGLAARALIVSGEYITHLMETAQKEISGRWDDIRNACLTLGDSGAAVILEESHNEQQGFRDIEMFTLGQFSDLCLAEPTYEAHGGFIMNTHSVKLHEVIIQEGVKVVVNKLKSRTHEYPINHFLMHQTARIALQKAIKYINHSLGKSLLHSGNTINNLQQRGNTSTTTHFVALWDKIHDSTINSKDTVFIGVQGSGITLGVAEYTFDDLPDRIRNGKRPEKYREGTKAGGENQLKKRITIGALGTALHSGDTKADGVGLASEAIRTCIRDSGCLPQEVGLLINAGVYQNIFIGEPAIAAFIARENHLNATAEDWAQATTLAYDLGAGACGFLLACWNGQAMISSGKTKTALCVSSEINTNTHTTPDESLGLKESGCAALLEEAPRGGFLQFLFKHYPEYHDAFRSEVCSENEHPYLKVSQKENLEVYIIQHISDMVQEFLEVHNLSMREINVIIPPQISGRFVNDFTDRLNLPKSKVVNLNDERNYYTCSTVFGLKHAFAKGMVHEGDLGLILEAGSGLTLAGALYQF